MRACVRVCVCVCARTHARVCVWVGGWVGGNVCARACAHRLGVTGRGGVLTFRVSTDSDVREGSSLNSAIPSYE